MDYEGRKAVKGRWRAPVSIYTVYKLLAQCRNSVNIVNLFASLKIWRRKHE